MLPGAVTSASRRRVTVNPPHLNPLLSEGSAREGVVQLASPDMDDHREAIWGIDPKDRQWFQLLTLIGGAAGSIILTQLELAYHSTNAGPNVVARNILLGIGASFVASGFIAWGLLQTKELIVAIADWIRKHTERDLERRHQKARQEGLREGLREGYEHGYTDAQEGKPKQPPEDASSESS